MKKGSCGTAFQAVDDAGWKPAPQLNDEYRKAVGIYLGLWLSRIAQRSSNVGIWNTRRETLEHPFGRQAIPMTWNYPEANPFSDSTGGAEGGLDWMIRVIAHESTASQPAEVLRGDGMLDEHLYVVQDANYNVTALFDNSGNVVERYVYDPFGEVTVLDANWCVPLTGSQFPWLPLLRQPAHQYKGTAASAGSEFAWVYLHQGGRFDATSGLYHFRNRDYSPTLGRWTSLDPLGYDAGDINLYRYVRNGSPNAMDPSGLWKICRESNKDKASAIAGQGDTIRTLACRIGLRGLEFRQWLSVSEVKLSDGRCVSLQDLKPDDVLAPGQEVLIPNVVYMLWIGDCGWLGQAMVGWGIEREYLKDLGFKVEVYDFRKVKDKAHASDEVLRQLEELSQRKSLHGFYVWGHGARPDPSGESAMMSRDGTFYLAYANVGRKLRYKLGLVIMNLCYGAAAKKHLSSQALGSVFKGRQGWLIPVLYDFSARKSLWPPMQGTVWGGLFPDLLFR